MLFNSLSFFIFFPVVTALYFLLPHAWRWSLLLTASCFFYMYFIPIYILILGFTIVVDYVAGLLIEGCEGRRRKLFLAWSIVANVGVLAFFKYFNFANENLAQVAQFLGWNYSLESLALVLPVGLSFHTFQAMSYTIEVYRGNQKAERHFGIYALYVMFYPQLVAGPIERPQNLLPQFRTVHAIDYRRMTDGMKLMAWGLFKKVVIADRLALGINEVYGRPHDFTGLPLVLATVFFAYQIYCDFSGYSDIAIGSAQVMGFRLMDNFNRPYFSKSIPEFWKRWHISLSTWFRDYLYIPLGGNRAKTWRWQFNLFLTFLVSGLWHGASWTYVVWGGLNGFYLMCSIWTRSLRQRFRSAFSLERHPVLLKGLRVAMTFTLISVSWIFFRANNMGDAWYILTHLLAGPADGAGAGASGLLAMGMGRGALLVAVLAIGFMECVHLLQRHDHIRQMLSERPAWVRWPVYYGILLMILFFGVFEQNQFIYFQF